LGYYDCHIPGMSGKPSVGHPNHLERQRACPSWEQAKCPRLGHRLPPPLNVELLVQRDGVALDGVRGDAEPFGYLPVRKSAAQMFEHLGLSIGE
jgi:hypothetical protein